MPKLTIDGQTVEIESGQRLVLAIREAGIQIGHRCGGNAECTTCRVEFLDGEPDTMTEAEYDRLVDEGLLGIARLSCQIEVTQDMTIHPLETVEDHPDWNGDPGPEPEEIVTPEAIWYPIEDGNQ